MLERKGGKIVIPEWKDAADAYDEGVATPLESFIANNEPAGPEDKAWREELSDLIEYIEEEYRTLFTRVPSFECEE